MPGVRRLLVASVVAAGLAGALAHGATPGLRRRKTLGFGPTLPHSVFASGETVPVVQAFGKSDPFDVAKAFASALTADVVSPASSFYVRDDSYTDKNTGVTHVYLRQTMFGMEIADGDINVNVKDGRILSYGDSFYRGTVTEPQGVDVHAEHCGNLRAQLEEAVDSQRQYLAVESQQAVLGSHAHTPGDIPTLFDWNCKHVGTPYGMLQSAKFDASPSEEDPSQALLQFMIAATPEHSLAEDIIHNPQQYLEKMTVVPQDSLVQGDRSYSRLVHNVPDAVNPVKARVAFVQVPHGDSTSLELVWKFEVEMQDNWYEAAVTHAAPHRIVSVVDWASDSPMPIQAPVPKEPRSGATYNVFPWGTNDPSEGNRTVLQEGSDKLASPAGWHSLPYANDPQSSGHLKNQKGFRNTTTTWGNNVFAHENWEGENAWVSNYRPSGGSDLEFDYGYDPKVTEKSDALAEAKKWIDVAVTQLFYTSNMVHDLYYRYGFDEVSGNFQQHNFGRGGRENDAVIANAQDGSGFNNANFMTPPDGQNGRCRMYIWNTAIPYRDGDLEAGIVIHELSHGLSTRLTGGPANSGCLGWGESGGMGEGWGDFLATTIRSTKNYSDYPMGAWAANREGGIRNYPYSLNETVNPSTYKTLDKPGYWGVHAIGEVWAQILWVVSHRLIAKHGFSDSLFPPEPLADGSIPEGDFYRPQEYDAAGEKKPLVPKHGNTLITQLVLNGMKLQPCRPSFFDARDAIIQADEVLTGGENFCDLWVGFASRGLGPDARVDGRTPWGGGVRTNDNSVPARCKSESLN
ncbi:extracellular elastinolytic metallo proteinase [Irpex rosettiformis]|uniref:Extracellular elastinolytic metallo proteinase n=1 Tax=Irpex rosettiformis TaxID=378272 RepID=A0ACB8TT81_9APHY|nr:extracellular elastinolytic metallo proteinase [Irpex rosettiformis]